MTCVLEIACFNIESAIIAAAAGADRIELCEDYFSGGLTPSENLIIETRTKIKIPIHVMIRPRVGNFVYSDSEIEQMKKAILFCKNNKINGVVFGVLNTNKEIDPIICEELIALAKPMTTTFHRAIDSCENLSKSVETLIHLNINNILTSGGASNALEGLEHLKSLHKQFGQKINIISGGQIRSENIQKLKTSGCTNFHSSAIVSKAIIADENEIKKIKSILNTGINL